MLYGIFLFLDLDECQLLNNDCEQICADTMGSFYCTCKDGFILNPDQSTCTQGKYISSMWSCFPDFLT